MRIAWFSPLPPVRTGVAACSADLIGALQCRFRIDAYPAERAHDFPWRHRLERYDLIIYQFGNSSHHDYEWAYALRYPGLVVLHDPHLHHARAAFLLREQRVDDYRAEFRWNHPDIAADAAEAAIAGFDSALYYQWNMVRALVDSARLVAVHGPLTRALLIEELADRAFDDKVVAIRLGHGELVTPERRERARREIRARHHIAADAVVFVCAGGITPEKRVPQVLRALHAIQPYAPGAHLLLVGPPAAHYDVRADIASLGLQERVTVTGYVEDDKELTDYLAAADVSVNLRWPSARETSGPWLRALGAGIATVVTDLVHLGDVPSMDPRTWTANSVSRTEDRGSRTEDRGPKDQGPGTTPVTIAIDILDEDHSLRLAMKRLVTDADLRERLAAAGQAYWQREHSPDVMVRDYERIISLALERPGNSFDHTRADKPAHLRDDGDRRLRALLGPFGVGDVF